MHLAHVIRHTVPHVFVNCSPGLQASGFSKGQAVPYPDAWGLRPILFASKFNMASSAACHCMASGGAWASIPTGKHDPPVIDAEGDSISKKCDSPKVECWFCIGGHEPLLLEGVFT